MNKRLNRFTRSYAALYQIAVNPDGLTATDVAKRLGISQTYARDLLETWVTAGLVLRYTEDYRKTAKRVVYFMGRTEFKRYERMGYKACAEEMAEVNRKFRRAQNNEYFKSLGL